MAKFRYYKWSYMGGHYESDDWKETVREYYKVLFPLKGPDLVEQEIAQNERIWLDWVNKEGNYVEIEVEGG